MGEVYGVWPSLTADQTLSGDYFRSSVPDGSLESLNTRSELIGEIARLTEQVAELSSELQTERAKPDADELLGDQRAEIDGKISAVSEHLTACMTAAMSAMVRLETQLLERIDQAEGRFGSQVAKYQLEQSAVGDDVVDLRSTQVSLVEQLASLQVPGAEVAVTDQVDELWVTLAEVAGQLREELSALRATTEGASSEVIDLRTRYEELDGRQFDAIAQSGRLREELQYESARLQDTIQESRQIAEKATYRSANAVNNIDALQADFDKAYKIAERRLGVMETLVSEIDVRVAESRTQAAAQFQALRAHQSTTAVAPEIDLDALTALVDRHIAARVDQHVAALVDHQVAARVDQQVAARVDQHVAARVDQHLAGRLEATTNKIDQVELIAHEHGKRGLAAADAVALRVRRIEAQLVGLANSDEGFVGRRGSQPAGGWQFERRGSRSE